MNLKILEEAFAGSSLCGCSRLRAQSPPQPGARFSWVCLFLSPIWALLPRAALLQTSFLPQIQILSSLLTGHLLPKPSGFCLPASMPSSICQLLRTSTWKPEPRMQGRRPPRLCVTGPPTYRSSLSLPSSFPPLFFSFSPKSSLDLKFIAILLNPRITSVGCQAWLYISHFNHNV